MEYLSCEDKGVKEKKNIYMDGLNTEAMKKKGKKRRRGKDEKKEGKIEGSGVRERKKIVKKGRKGCECDIK